MKRRLAGFALSGATGALSSALAPIVALLLLRPTEYGLFSIPYLVYAFGVSLQYSIVSEAWARLRMRGGDETVSWRDYSSALAILAAIVGLIAGVLSLLIVGHLLSALLMVAAVPFAVYQNGARYFRVATGSIRRVLFSDLAGVVAFGVGLFAFMGLHDLSWIGGTWLLAGLAAVSVLGFPRFAWGTGLAAWSRRNHRVIRPLLFDSLLMDAGAIGTPFLLAGLMGPRDFGIYRAVANVAMPVRLLVEPIRPLLGRMEPRRLFSMSLSAVVLGTGIVLAAACYGVLVVVLPRLDFQLGTLMALVPYALPTSLFVAGNFFITVYYFYSRTRGTQRHLMIGRIVQTVLVIVLPILGFVLSGLGGAIWGFAISCVLASVVWMVLARAGLRDGDAPLLTSA